MYILFCIYINIFIYILYFIYIYIKIRLWRVFEYFKMRCYKYINIRNILTALRFPRTGSRNRVNQQKKSSSTSSTIKQNIFPFVATRDSNSGRGIVQTLLDDWPIVCWIELKLAQAREQAAGISHWKRRRRWRVDAGISLARFIVRTKRRQRRRRRPRILRDISNSPGQICLVVCLRGGSPRFNERPREEGASFALPACSYSRLNACDPRILTRLCACVQIYAPGVQRAFESSIRSPTSLSSRPLDV